MQLDTIEMPVPAPLVDDSLPFTARENVRRRHAQMVALRREGWSYDRIAAKVGLYSGSTAEYHVSGACKCMERFELSRRSVSRVLSEVK